MNEDMIEMLAEEMGLGWCPIVNSYVDNDCFKCCEECKDYIEFNKYFDEEKENE